VSPPGASENFGAWDRDSENTPRYRREPCPAINAKWWKGTDIEVCRQRVGSHCISSDREVLPAGYWIPRAATGRYPGFRIFCCRRRLLTIHLNRNGRSLSFKESLSGTSPVTVAGPLRNCTVFLGSLKRVYSRPRRKKASSENASLTPCLETRGEGAELDGEGWRQRIHGALIVVEADRP